MSLLNVVIEIAAVKLVKEANNLFVLGSTETGTKSFWNTGEKPGDLVDDECPGDDERK